MEVQLLVLLKLAGPFEEIRNSLFDQVLLVVLDLRI
jgi:hypothetical protein